MPVMSRSRPILESGTQGRARRRRIAWSLVMVAMLSVLVIPPPVWATNWDGTNPGATACGDGSHTVYTLKSASILSASGAQIGRVDLRQSVYCGTVWSRVCNLTSSSISSREKLITYDTPNGTGSTTYTETDTLSKKGGATECGWSKQYNDRPAFKARGELSYGGSWRIASTLQSNAYNQFDGNFPNSPFSCDETAGDYCHRWPTNANGTPVTRQYAFDSTMYQLPADPIGDINDVLAGYEALSGGSPNWDTAPVGQEDVLFYVYNDSTDRAYARALSSYRSTAPQIYLTGYVKFNKAQLGGSTDYHALVCHEFMHILGFLHVTTDPYVGSKATCMGAEHNAPAIDDKWLIPQVYATPLFGE